MVYAESERENVQRQFIIIVTTLSGRNFGGIGFAYPASGTGYRNCPHRYCNQTNANRWRLKQKVRFRTRA